MTQTELPAMLTLKEAMTYLRVSRSKLYRLTWSGQLPRYKVGSTLRFYKADLDKCIKWTPAQPPNCLASDIRTDAVHQQI